MAATFTVDAVNQAGSIFEGTVKQLGTSSLRVLPQRPGSSSLSSIAASS